MGPNWTSKFLHSKGNFKQDEKTTFRMGENNQKRSKCQKLNPQNIQVVRIANIRKTNNLIKKMGGRSKQTFLQRWHTESQQIDEKLLNISHY